MEVTPYYSRAKGAGTHPDFPNGFPYYYEKDKPIFYQDDGYGENRFPAYHSLNLRLDHQSRVLGVETNVYLNLFNVYQRQNYSSYFWNLLTDFDQADIVALPKKMSAQFGMTLKF